MAVFAHASIRPDTYLVKGRKYRIGRDDNALIASNVRGMLAAGINIPVLPFHAEEGTEWGGPAMKRQDAKENIGWVKDAKVDRKGRLRITFDVHSPEHAEAIRTGQIRFTSPELTKSFTDETGGIWGPCVRHLAMTPLPKVSGTDDIEEVVEQEALPFSAIEVETLGFSLMTDDEAGSEITEEPESKLKKKQEEEIVDEKHVAELLEKLGINPPRVCFLDKPNDWMRELVASMQQKATHDFVTAPPKSDTKKPLGVKEESYMTAQFAQFSALADNPDPLVQAMYLQFSQEMENAVKYRTDAAREVLVAKIAGANWIGPKARELLAGRLQTIQFSATAEATIETPTFTLGEVLEVLEAQVPPESRIVPAVLVEPPEDLLKQEVIDPTKPKRVTREEAMKIVDEELRGQFRPVLAS